VTSTSQDRGYALVNKGVSLYSISTDKKRSDKAKEHYKEALKCFEEAINKNPNDSHSWVFKGICLEMLGFHDRAIRCYDEVIDINQEFDYAWFRRGLSLDYVGKYDEALEYFEEAINKIQLM
jgi:tetratricopeptide (TPR) repeat protein